MFDYDYPEDPDGSGKTVSPADDAAEEGQKDGEDADMVDGGL